MVHTLYDYSDDKKSKEKIIEKKKRVRKIFQEKFKTNQIPLKQEHLKQLIKEVEYPYPPQVMALGTMFPIPIPKDIKEDIKGKIVRVDGDVVYLRQSKNITVCYPTSSGKTFLLKCFMLKHVESKDGVSFYVVPLKALAEEKFNEFSKQFPDLKIGMMTGDYQRINVSKLENYDIIVTIYEKLDSMLRNNKDIMKLVTNSIVIDEIHVMQSDRGPAIEDFITKYKELGSIPIMAASATVGNVQDIADWLESELLFSTFRPVPLKKGMLIEKEIEFEDGTFEKFEVNKKKNVEEVLSQLLSEGSQVMYVRATRRNAASFAKKMTGIISEEFRDESLELPKLRTDDDRALNRCVKYGVAWHHAGLETENRLYVENMFREGKLRFLCATTTLSAGINIPARYVFLDFKRWKGYGMEPISIMEAMQILGRAGRPQYDDVGFGVFVCKNEADYNYCMETYLEQEPEPIESPLLASDNLFHSIIGNIGGGYAKTEQELFRLYSYSFGYFQDKQKMKLKIRKTLLQFKYFSEPLMNEIDGEYFLTKIGEKVKQFYVHPTDGEIFIQMIKDCKALSTLSLVHAVIRCNAIYPLSPKVYKEWYDNIDVITSMLYYNEVDFVDRGESRALQTALILVGYDAKDEIIFADENVPMNKICQVYGIQSGDIQRIVGGGGKMFWMLQFAYSIAHLYGKKLIKNLIREVEIRLRYGVGKRLVPICKIKYIGKERGRALFQLGYCDIESISMARISDLSDVDVNGERLGVSNATKIIKSASELFRKGIK